MTIIIIIIIIIVISLWLLWLLLCIYTYIDYAIGMKGMSHFQSFQDTRIMSHWGMANGWDIPMEQMEMDGGLLAHTQLDSEGFGLWTRLD